MIMLPIVLYGCVTWCLTWRMNTNSVFENNILWKIYSTKRECRKLYTSKLNVLYASNDLISIINSSETFPQCYNTISFFLKITCIYFILCCKMLLNHWTDRTHLIWLLLKSRQLHKCWQPLRKICLLLSQKNVQLKIPNVRKLQVSYQNLYK